jgi:hypothetical protein
LIVIDNESAFRRTLFSFAFQIMGLASFTNMVLDRQLAEQAAAEAAAEAEADTLKTEEIQAPPRPDPVRPPARITPKAETTKKAG